ncbi:MAG: bifunctional 5,10-methylenetetrahydrofolate dehydrogenase/5,10-methenyltetrahydrofolate cyclohydrolase [Bacilli bacterium]
MKILYAKPVVEKLTKEIKEELDHIQEKLKLVVIRVGEDESSIIYVNNKRKSCLELGIDFTELHFPIDTKEEKIISKIKKLNKDTTVTSILVQLPLPKQLNTNKIINEIDYKKDVDGLTNKNMGNLFTSVPSIIPCTASGIMQLLKYYKIPLDHKKILLLGRSSLIGKPLIPLLLKENATLTIAHSHTIELSSHIAFSDIVITGCASPHTINKTNINPNLVVIDASCNKENNKLMGDADFNEIVDSINAITPVPGGIGPLTVINVLLNIIKCYHLQK